MKWMLRLQGQDTRLWGWVGVKEGGARAGLVSMTTGWRIHRGRRGRGDLHRGPVPAGN